MTVTRFDPAATAESPQAARLLAVCAGRAIDGAALHRATDFSNPPDVPPISDPATRDLVRDAVTRWRTWVKGVFGDLTQMRTNAWQPERLAYGVEVFAANPGGGRARLAAHPGREGFFDWYAFDEAVPPEAGYDDVQAISRNLLPIAVGFRGMPHSRWWQFQDRIADLGEIQPEMRELAKLMLMDFMFVHGNDWFLVPFTQEVGSLCRVDRLLVHDVFGGKTLVERADRQEPGQDDARR